MKMKVPPKAPIRALQESEHPVQRVVVGAVALAVAYAVVQNLPDIIRYLKMRKM